jgi:hypothetical protein
VDIAEDDICLPMRGKMMAQYTGDDTEAVEKYLLHHIQIEIDSQRVLVQQIKQILFLGDRATYGPQELGPIASDSSNVGLAVSLSLSFSLLVIALYVVIGRRRRQIREESHNALNVSKDGIMDIPHGNTGSMHSGSNDDCSLNSQDAEVPSSNVNPSATEQEAMDLIMDDISDCPSDSPALHPQDLAVNTKMVDMLPPLAPGTRSKTMKKRRRKKKKVKRNKLTRTNSRENINEMSTITEANEDEVLSDDDDTNSGTNSEYYSTDDEDSVASVGRTSRDPSPARSRTGSLGSAASGGSGGVPPSPIKEEPDTLRIPRLPPPYV